MAYTIQGHNKDCVIVSLANISGKPYEEIMGIAETYCGLTRQRIESRGTPLDRIPILGTIVLGKILRERKPRRGQEKLTGIVGWFRTSSKSGHMTCIIDGNVFDTDGKIYPVEEYRDRFNYHLRVFYGVD